MRPDDSPLAQWTLAWIREFVREPEAVFWTFMFPVVLALALGIAFRGGGADTVHVAIETGPRAQMLAAALAADARIEVRVLDADDAARALRRGDVGLVVATDGDTVVYRHDAARGEGRTARLLADAALQQAAGRQDVLGTRDVLTQERGARYIDFLVPGLLGLNLLSTGLWGVGFTIVRMRRDRLLKRLRATPIPRPSFLLGFMLGRLAFLAFEVPLLLGFAWLAFGVPVRGSLLDLAAIAVLGAFTFTGLGVLLASRARTTEGVTGLMNLASLPMWVLSGVFFSADHFPDAMQPLIRALPLTALVDAMRDIMLDGASLVGVAAPVAVLAVWGLGCLAIALPVFRWQ